MRLAKRCFSAIAQGASGVADLHVDEAIVMPPHTDLIKGKEAIKQNQSETIDLLRKHGAKTGKELDAEGK